MGDDEQISLQQIWDNTNWCRATLTNPNPKYTQITLSHKYKPKNQRFTNTKYEYQISNVNCAQTKERATKQIQKLQRTKRVNHQTAEPKPSRNKPLSLFQIATHKYQITKQRESLYFSHTLSSLSL